MPYPATTVQTATAEFLVSIRQAAQNAQVRRLLEALTGIDATGLERMILFSLEGLELVPMKRVASELQVTLPLLSRSCARLQSQELLVKIRDPRDERRALVGLTDSAASALANWRVAWPTGYAAPVADWNPEDRDKLGRWFAAINYELLGHAAVPHDRDPWRPPAGMSILETPGIVRFTNAAKDLVVAAGRSDLVTDLARAVAQMEGTTFFTLFALCQRERRNDRGVGLSVTHLAALQAVDPALTRRIIAGLIDRAFVATASPIGGRGVMVSTTRAGRSMVSRVIEGYGALLPRPPAQSEHVLGHLFARYVASYELTETELMASLGSKFHGNPME